MAVQITGDQIADNTIPPIKIIGGVGSGAPSWKTSCRVASTVVYIPNNAPSSVDSVALNVNDRVMVTGGGAGSGIYRVQFVGTGANGIWVRAADADSAADFTDGGGFAVRVLDGGTKAGSCYAVNVYGAFTLDVTVLSFYLMPGAGALDVGVLPGPLVNRNFIGGGTGHNLSTASFSSVVGGTGNVVGSGASNAFIGGGVTNTASSSQAVIGGGANNVIQSVAGPSVIGGGSFNQIKGLSFPSCILGGQNNKISPFGLWADYCAIVGGNNNTIDGGALQHCFIGGGSINTINSSAGQSAIVGGNANVVSASRAFIGGGLSNVIVGGADFAAICGGQSNSVSILNGFIGGGFSNAVSGTHSVICGGYDHTASGAYSFVGGGGTGFLGQGNTAAAFSSAIVGGSQNSINAASPHGFIGGGQSNGILSGASFSTIGGGRLHFVGISATDAVIAGGVGNTIGAAASKSAIGGGEANQTTGQWATVPGGSFNTAAGDYSFAAGQKASALHVGSFVWADSQVGVFASTAFDQFSIRAIGGVRLAADLVPDADNTRVIGTDSLRWNRVRATVVVTGDLELRDDEAQAHWVIKEMPDCIEAFNKKTGKKFRLRMDEVS